MIKRERVATKRKHTCEVCDVEEMLTPDEAFDGGWDYPPRMGRWGVISPRTCPNCLIAETAWWAVMVEHVKPNVRQQRTIERILGETR